MPTSNPLHVSPLAGREARIAAAATYARLFCREAERALKNEKNQMVRAAAHLVRAIETIEDSEPQCKHGDFYQHEVTGECVHPDCTKEMK